MVKEINRAERKRCLRQRWCGVSVAVQCVRCSTGGLLAMAADDDDFPRRTDCRCPTSAV